MPVRALASLCGAVSGVRVRSRGALSGGASAWLAGAGPAGLLDTRSPVRHGRALLAGARGGATLGAVLELRGGFTVLVPTCRFFGLAVGRLARSCSDLLLSAARARLGRHGTDEALGTVEQGAVRFSFSHYNTEEEVDMAIRAICELAEEE